MARGKTLDAVMAETEQMLRVWTANPTFAMGDLTQATVQSMLDDLRKSRQDTNETRTLLTRLIDETNDKAKALTKINTRIRSGIKATFGPDSPQYEQAGGKRESERKPRSSKKKS